MNWTTPAMLRRQLMRLWDSGEILAAAVRGESLFPRRLRLTRPDARELAARFGEVGDWVRALKDGSREARGRGYVIEWREVRHRVHGANALPAAIAVPTTDDALFLIGKTAEAAQFRGLVTDTLDRFPSLEEWLARRPLTVLAEADGWSRILDVLTWFQAHQRPGLYLRELDIPGVDTKFIESRRRLLAELLDVVLPASAVESGATGVRGFARRFGLREKPALVRFRFLDRGLYLRGLSDLTVPVHELAGLRPPVRRVFITENETNGLAFPDVPDSLVIFGLGYGVQQLFVLPWLTGVTIHYWGDIDTHGFAILDRLRGSFPRARSLLMNRATLEKHRHLCVEEPADTRFTGELTRLTPPERSLFEDLRDNRLGEGLRLEQERIGFGWLQEVLATLMDGLRR